MCYIKELCVKLVTYQKLNLVCVSENIKLFEYCFRKVKRNFLYLLTGCVCLP